MVSIKYGPPIILELILAIFSIIQYYIEMYSISVANIELYVIIMVIFVYKRGAISMGTRMKGLLGLVLLFGLLATAAGLMGVLSQTEYNAPIYISQKFTLEHKDDGRYFAIGEFANRTNKDITITELSFKLHSGVYYANAKLKEIVNLT